MTNQNETDKLTENEIENKKGKYNYEICRENGNGDFLSAQRGLGINHRVGWNTYFWPDKYAFSASLKMRYADARQHRIALEVRLIDSKARFPEELNKILVRKGFHLVGGDGA